jgi:hypothetical protein
MQGSLPFVDVCNNLKSGFYSVLLECAFLYSGDVVLSGISQNVKCILASNRDEFAIFRPVNLTC